MDQQEQFSQARELQRAGKFSEAEALFQKILSANPRHAEALTQIGALQIQRGQVQQGLRTLDASLAINERQQHAHNNRGSALSMIGQLDAALEAFSRAIALDPSVAPAYLNRAIAFETLGRFREALADYDYVLTLEPRNSAVLTSRALILLQLDIDAAQVACERALAVQPNNIVVINCLGIVFYRRGQFAEALACFDRVAALNPRNGEYHINRAHVLRELQRPNEAALAYQRGLALSQNYPHAMGDLALAKLTGCDWADLDELIAHIRQAVDRGAPATLPFTLNIIGASPEQQFRCATRYAEDAFRGVARAPSATRSARTKIRLGYFSSN